VIAARVNPTDIDQVHVGQAATLVFSSFSTRTMPELRGAVTLVSPDAFSDERLQQSYYRAELTLSDEAISALADRQLLPGMPVEVFIRTQDRTPLDYLTRPMTEYFARAFRDS
jgi:HlyD family secretion protein